jgi:hypothetical protein
VSDDVFYYSASSDKLALIGGRGNRSVAQSVSVEALVNILQLTWITDINLGGARLALGGAVPYGQVQTDADVFASTRSGMALVLSRSDQTTAFGDPVLGASLGWRRRDADHFRAWNLYGSLYVPVGSYRVGSIANIGTNRWGLDLGSAFTMTNSQRGRELSGILGVTFNGENPDTDYRSGTDLHLELAYKQHLPRGISVGLVGYYYQQITADSGPNLLGDFKGRVAALGPVINYRFKGAGRTMSLDLRWYHEFAAQNRVEGNAVFLTFALPLQPDTPAAR